MERRQPRGHGGQDKKCPIHDAPHPWRSPRECCSYEAASLESKKEGKNMCNLSRKEGSSLFAALAKRQRKMLPKNLPLRRSGFCFLPGRWTFSLESSGLGSTRSECTGPGGGGVRSPAGGGGHVIAGASLALHLGTLPTTLSRGKPSAGEVNALCYTRPAVSLTFHGVAFAWRSFLSLKVKTNSIHPFTSR